MSSKKFYGYTFDNQELFTQALVYLHDNNTNPKMIVSLDWKHIIMKDGSFGLLWPEDISTDGIYQAVLESQYGPCNTFMSDTDFVVLPETII
jgi:hypothetical protein